MYQGLDVPGAVEGAALRGSGTCGLVSVGRQPRLLGMGTEELKQRGKLVLCGSPVLCKLRLQGLAYTQPPIPWPLLWPVPPH